MGLETMQATEWPSGTALGCMDSVHLQMIPLVAALQAGAQTNKAQPQVLGGKSPRDRLKPVTMQQGRLAHAHSAVC